MHFRNIWQQLILIVILLTAADSGWAEQVSEKTSEPEVSAKEAIPENLSSPRATMETFLHAMNDIKRGAPDRIEAAVSTLDLSDINPIVRKERGQDLAWMLLEVLDRTEIINIEKIPNRVDGSRYLFKRYERGEVAISRTDSGRWLFDRNTINSLPTIMDEVATTERVSGKDDEASYVPWHIRLR
ncbi:MAG: hypothetical protein ABW141_02780, partial [Candidatus Thiodiazotropha endolucinida]